MGRYLTDDELNEFYTKVREAGIDEYIWTLTNDEIQLDGIFTIEQLKDLIKIIEEFK